MRTYHDRKTDRTFFTQPAHPIVASFLLLGVLTFFGFCVVMPFIERDSAPFWVLEAMCFAFAVFLSRMCLEAFTEIVLTFDGRSRTLAVSRERPWRRTDQSFRYGDIFDVGGRESTIIAPDASFYIWVARSYWLDVAVTGNRRIRLRADSAAERDIAVTRINHLIRAS